MEIRYDLIDMNMIICNFDVLKKSVEEDNVDHQSLMWDMVKECVSKDNLKSSKYHMHIISDKEYAALVSDFLTYKIV